MSCINPNDPKFKAILERVGNPLLAEIEYNNLLSNSTIDNIKPGVLELYDSNSELSAIGTPQQYSQYLDTIFPDSKVKDIVYHGSGVNIISKEGWKTGKETGTGHRGILGYYFTKYLLDAKIYAQRAGSPKTTPESLLQQGYIVPVIINAQNKTVETEIYDRFAEIRRWEENYKNFDTVTYGQGLDENKEIVVKDKEQIHILGSKQDIEGFKAFVKNETVETEVKQGVSELFKSSPELANTVYEALGFKQTITQDNKSYYRGQIEKPTIDKDGNLVLFGREDELYKKAGLKSKGVSMTDDLQSAIEYGNGQLEVSQNLASETYDANRELERLSENGYYLIQIPKNISNEITKEAGEVKVTGNKIIIPKGQYKIEQVVDGVEQITLQQKQQAEQLYSQYLDTIFPDSKIKDIVYHVSNSKFEKFDNNFIGKSKLQASPDNELGIFFTKDVNYIKKEDKQNELGENIYSTIINIKNPNTNYYEILDKFIPGLYEKDYISESSRKYYNQTRDFIKSNNQDGIIESARPFVVVFDASQTHILGSKQDVQAFKDFVNKTQDQTPIKNLNTKLKEGFLADFNFDVQEYDSIKETLGYNNKQMVDLVSKFIALEKGGNLEKATAYVAYKLLSKKNNKLSGELKFRINSWDKYNELFKKYAEEIKEKVGFIEDKTKWKNTIKEKIIIDFLAESIVEYYNNPKEFEKTQNRKWSKEDFTLFEKMYRWLKNTFSNKEKDLKRLYNISYEIADEVLNNNYDIFEYKLEEEQIQKYYKETIESDSFAKSVVEYFQQKGIILTGSLALRYAGSVYRTEKENLHDLDFIVPYDIVSSKENIEVLNNIKNYQGIDENASSVITLSYIKDFSWIKDFKKAYPTYQVVNGFYGKEHGGYESFTLTGVIDGEFYQKSGYHLEKQRDGTQKKVAHEKGDYVKDTGYVVDHFIRLKSQQEHHENYFKLWKEIMIAKLKMNRKKDLIDFVHFIPFLKSKDTYNFYYPEYVYSERKEDKGKNLSFNEFLSGVSYDDYYNQILQRKFESEHLDTLHEDLFYNGQQFDNYNDVIDEMKRVGVYQSEWNKYKTSLSDKQKLEINNEVNHNPLLLERIQSVEDLNEYFNETTKKQLEDSKADVILIEGSSEYNPKTNTISISLGEIAMTAEKAQLSPEEVLNTIVQHETMHSLSIKALSNKGIQNKVRDLISIVLKEHSENPFVDTTRGGFNINRLPYGLAFSSENNKDVLEFFAEAFSNPYFTEYLRNIKIDNTTIWQKIINLIKNFFNITTNDLSNVYSQLQAIRLSEEFTLAQEYEDDINEDRLFYNNVKEKTANEILTDFIENNGIDKILFKNLSDLISALKTVQKSLPARGKKDVVSEKLAEMIKIIDTKDTLTSISGILSQMISIRQIIDDIGKATDKIINSTDNAAEKITAIHTGLKQLASFKEYISLSNKILADIKREKGIDLADARTVSASDDASRKSLLRLLESIAGPQNRLQESLSNLQKDPLYEYLYSLVPEETLAKVQEYEREILRLQDLLVDPERQNEESQKYLKGKIAELTEIITVTMPSSPEWFKKHLSGEIGEIGSINKFLEAAQLSKSPLVQIVAKMFKDVSLEAERESIRITNKVSTAKTALLEVVDQTQLREDKLHEPILTKLTVIEEIDEDGNVTESYERDALLNIYTPEFKYDHDLLKKIRQQKGELLVAANVAYQENPTDENKTLATKAREVYNEAKQNLKQFEENHVEREFIDNYYDTDKILDEPISSLFPGVTLRQRRGDMYQRLSELNIAIENEKTDGIREALLNEADYLNVKIKDLSVLENKVKDSEEYFLALKAQEYSKRREDLGLRSVTAEMQDFFNRQYEHKKEERAGGYITEREFAIWEQQNTKEMIDPDYFTDLGILYDLVASKYIEIFNIIDNDPQGNVFQTMNIKTSKESIKALNEELKNLTYPYRDNNGIINGILLENIDEKEGTKLREKIKEMQEEIEAIRQIQDQFNGESLSDKAIGFENDAEFRQELARERKRLGLDPLLKTIKRTFQKINDISETIDTHYYDEQTDIKLREFADTIENKDIIDLIKDNIYQADGNKVIFDEVNGILYVNRKYVNAQEKLFNQTKQDFYNTIKMFEAYKTFETSQWYIDNHYDRLVYDEISKSWEEKSTPLYIWKVSRPTDKSLISIVAGNKYSTFEIAPEVFNPNYVKLPDGTLMPKSDKYKNKDFIALRDAADPKSKAYYNYLTTLREVYYESQQRDSVSNWNKFGDATPSLLKTTDELRVDIVLNNSSFSKIKDNLTNLYNSIRSQSEEDVNSELEGIVSKKSVDNKIIPELLSGKMKSEQQSKNLSGSILMHSLFTSKREKLLGIEPIVNSIVNVSKQKAPKKIKKGTFNKIFDSGNEDLTEVLENLITAEMYGSRVDNIDLTIMGVDLNKLMNKVMRINAFSSFAANIYSPIKNTFGGKVQSFIEANKNFGKYSNLGWAKAEVEAVKMISDLSGDYAKFGNQTLTTQMLDYFQVMQGTRADKLGHKTQWNKVKNFLEILTSPKDLSEFQLQLTQFIALADNVFIDTTEGKKTLREMFTLDQDNTIVVKDILTPEQKVKFEQKSKDFVFSMHHLNLMINGAYRLEEKAMFQRNIIGRAVFFMNQYLLPGLARRYSRNRYYLGENDTYRGFYITTLKYLIADTYKYGFNFKERYADLSDTEKHNLMKTAKEAMILTALPLLIMGIGGGDEDKELDKERKLMLAYLMGISTEAQTFNPIAGTDEMIRKIKNPFIFARSLTQMRNGTVYAISSMFGDEDAYYKRDTGIYKKGDSKAMANFMKLLSLTPSNVFTFDVDAIYRQQKMLYDGTIR